MRCASCQSPTVRHAWYCFRCQLQGKAVLPRLVVGIGGRARYGKTTAAEVMAAELQKAGFTSLFLSISDLVLTELHSSQEVNKRYDRAYAGTENGKWLLDKLIVHGRKRRAEDEDYWLGKLAERYLTTKVQRSKDSQLVGNCSYKHGSYGAHTKTPLCEYWIASPSNFERADVLIVTLRFPNELRWVEQAGGITIHVMREGFVSDDRPSGDDMETSLDGCVVDYEIRHKDGQLAWLKGQAQALVRSVLL